ncbi:hypothetical protein N9D31_01415 [Oligoflexaceae bacterium]|nr:hypothetical protein [Oligoflexaceae bacterium]
MLLRLSMFSLLSSFLVLTVGCGRDEATSRSNDSETLVSSQGANAQNQVVYCDDLVQETKGGLPYQYPSDCMQSPDSEPLINVIPGGTNPGQTPGYNNPGQSPGYNLPEQYSDYNNQYSDPSWQQPGTYPQDPNYNQDPNWQEPGYQPADPQYPNDPQWQTPNSSNPQNQNPGYDGEPLPY